MDSDSRYKTKNVSFSNKKRSRSKSQSKGKTPSLYINDSISNLELPIKKKIKNSHNITVNHRKSLSKSSIIYYLILCHGGVNFTKDSDNQIIPVMVNIPNEIEYFNKITFAPLGLKNMMSIDDHKYIYNKLKKEIPKLYSKQEGYGDIFANKLKTDYDDLLDPFHYLDSVKLLKHRTYLHMLNNNKEQFYQSVIYDENNKNPIIQKDFGLDPIISRSETQDVFVIYQKGGKLKSGERILYNNAIFKDYMVKLWETNTVENTDGNGNFKYYPRLSTDELLNISVEYGYKKVVIIDYSCDSCRNIVELSTKIPRNIIMSFREKVKRGELARGGNRKTRKHIIV